MPVELRSCCDIFGLIPPWSWWSLYPGCVSICGIEQLVYGCGMLIEIWGCAQCVPLLCPAHDGLKHC